MLDSKMISLLILISMAYLVSGSYRYVGCYRRIFYNNYHFSSYMEPTLCFLLCKTPIIYISGQICRCSGIGPTDHYRQEDRLCTMSCRKPGTNDINTVLTCGGEGTYSAYAEENFYTKHALLFNYQIVFTSCELWNTSNYYDILQVNIDKSSAKSPLNILERCATVCLDQNPAIKSIGRRNI